ncbi:MAG TPA: LytTR family DNA-binding domain-containing protein [Thermoanaerobaculia bacterium]|nr:LytTR family DNA-binding domain-containing protein [Thermoanaerobaculia bacterium]
MLRALIVDDERLAREKIRTFLATRDDVTVVGEAANVKQAVAAITHERPDLVFLDIQMPGGDGFDIARALPETTAVVFVTAHEEHALRAFDIAAVDYLLKPFDRRRFDQAVERAKKSGGRPREAAAAFFTVRKRDKVLLVAVRDVDWIEAEGKYVRIHVREQSHLIRDGIAAVETRLDKRQFVRIHRSTIVNLRRIAEMQRGEGGDYIVVMHDGTRLTLSRRFRAHVREMTGLDL